MEERIVREIEEEGSENRDKGTKHLRDVGVISTLLAPSHQISTHFVEVLEAAAVAQNCVEPRHEIGTDVCHQGKHTEEEAA